MNQNEVIFYKLINMIILTNSIPLENIKIHLKQSFINDKAYGSAKKSHEKTGNTI